MSEILDVQEEREYIFRNIFNHFQKKAHENAVNKGFWPDLGSSEAADYQYAAKVALIHSEASELLETIRHRNPQSRKIPDFTSIEEELADIVIRVMDMAGKQDWRVGEAIIAKMTYNASRPHKHGKTL